MLGYSLAPVWVEELCVRVLGVAVLVVAASVGRLADRGCYIGCIDLVDYAEVGGGLAMIRTTMGSMLSLVLA